MSLEEAQWTMYPALSASFVFGAIDFIVPGHVVKAFAAPVANMFGLVDVGYIFQYYSLPKHVEPSKDALIGEVQTAVAVATVLLDGLGFGTFLHNVSLFVTVVAEVIVASALKKGMLDWTSIIGGQGHPIFGGYPCQGIGNMSVTQLLHNLHLLHPPLHSVHLHVDHKQGV